MGFSEFSGEYSGSSYRKRTSLSLERLLTSNRSSVPQRKIYKACDLGDKGNIGDDKILVMSKDFALPIIK